MIKREPCAQQRDRQETPGFPLPSLPPCCGPFAHLFIHGLPVTGLLHQANVFDMCQCHYNRNTRYIGSFIFAYAPIPMHAHAMTWLYESSAIDTSCRHHRVTLSLYHEMLTHSPNLQAGVEIMKDVKEWEKQEEARKAKALEQVLHFKSMRESQVLDKEARRQRVRNSSAYPLKRPILSDLVLPLNCFLCMTRASAWHSSCVPLSCLRCPNFCEISKKICTHLAVGT